MKKIIINGIKLITVVFIAFSVIGCASPPGSSPMFAKFLADANADSMGLMPEFRRARSYADRLNGQQHNMNLKVFKDCDIDLSSYKTYSIEYTNKENRLLEKELFKMVETTLLGKLVRSDKNPDILITMNFYTGKREQYIPPKTVITTKVKNIWSFNAFGWGYNTPVPITQSHTVSGHTSVSYYRNIRLNFLDFKQLSTEVELEVPPLIWVGEVESTGTTPDIRIVAPRLLKQLLMEYPKKSGRNMTGRRIYSIDYGYTGISVATLDERIIGNIDPGSPAEKAGLKAGDMLISVVPAGRKLHSWEPKHISKNCGPWPAFGKTAYFKHVIKSYSRPVIFTVKSGGGQEKKKYIEVTPINTRREYY